MPHGDDADSRGVQDEDHPDPGEQGQLVVGAEQLDGCFLQPGRDEVNDAIADVEDWRSCGCAHGGHQLGDRQGSSAGGEANGSSEKTARSLHDARSSPR